ncbi:pentapeptide repeat-containing protein [Paenilisteria rocourtiae]|uniref:Uncharacterized protein YjbI with pentapeptide repeats n=1 Tax=Listeria rocourtiae TaxID=647910 RepID=A0A4R6ZLP8_9LIST|nr:pentapeptide repeat-containing protein [Listeria rocourtiae]EUJ43626.1 hypothetical protein PROCOU_15354 [Listeria rocourtiae FSL F6-920]MBC1605979.1 pentapeptide repeat-containing protein [Listeria rocourtiae]TDR53202.1 uncharacterized protein YjbI with pentapeptide repeats [Listeria rocourtiae]
MNEKLIGYIDGQFSAYEDTTEISELKEELVHDLQEKYDELEEQGYDEEEAYELTIHSLGDISEVIESIGVKRKMSLEDNPAWQEIEEAKQRAANNDGTIRRKVLEGFNFSNSDLRNSYFDDGEFRSVNFKHSNLAGVNFDHRVFIDTKFDYVNLTGASFESAEFHNGSLKGTYAKKGDGLPSFKGAFMQGVNVSTATLKGADFSYANLANSKFNASELTNASFEGADLTFAELKQSALSKTNFANAIFDQTDFSYSDLSKSNFDGEVFRGTIFRSTGLVDATFRDAIFENVSFKGSYVKRADFTGAQMDLATYESLKKNRKADLSGIILV